MNVTLSAVRIPILNVNRANILNAKVIVPINMIVHVFINLTSLLQDLGCLAPICWLEYSAYLFTKLYLNLPRYILGLGITDKCNAV